MLRPSIDCLFPARLSNFGTELIIIDRIGRLRSASRPGSPRRPLPLTTSAAEAEAEADIETGAGA
ncbi:hypothetical protein ABT300_43970, partial [Streptomyces sp. NPDC001027]|uniref:hypothetical protein n=1 Tax=Streptomyces sp. NPDC001027 TaxID=3154771 RepID=UPI00332C8C7C